MPSNAPDLNFGPSERYLPGKKLVEGDVLTINILEIEKDEVDTDYGSKLQFHINVLSSSSDAVSPGKYTWRTIAAAPRKIHAYYYTDAEGSGEHFTDFAHWVWKLTVMENGVSLKTLNSNSDQSESTTTHGTPAPGNITADAGDHVL
jgi:hypothetical protein